ncbi:MAG: hypothetical protein LBG45_12120 [Dysgonamonadaceae bacterium]|jgi:hypothetical protein|nr:hypothetical protein [Dysgonamonadaceae bacterium]
MMIRNLDPDKLSKLHKTENLLEKRYGKRGTPEREVFHDRALSRYYTDMQLSSFLKISNASDLHFSLGLP